MPDGTSMDYGEYIHSHPHWQAVRKARFDFDGGRCVMCHCNLEGKRFETHHISYLHLGNEHLRDVITLCPTHHIVFHNNWKKQEFWKGREPDHWNAFSLEHTARLCAKHYKSDMFISRDPDGINMCNKDTIRRIVDEYIKSCDIDPAPVIDLNDIMLFVRNKRWERVLAAAEKGMSIDQFLDKEFGKKVRGKNKLRSAAGSNSSYKHDIKSIRRHYGENKNIYLLMQEVKKYE